MTEVRTIENLAALAEWAGKEIACSDWMTIDQDRIQRFADATGDQQWIHIDQERARLESPYQATVAHGYLTLSLLPTLIASCLRVDGVRLSINYGLDRVRFPAPVRVNRRVRARLTLDRLEPIEGGLQAYWSATVDIDGESKPACVAQMLSRLYPIPTTG
jgi:acyl dehydratase